MKKIVIFALVLLCSCAGGGRSKTAATVKNSVKTTEIIKNNTTMDDLILNDEFEWFDQARYDQRPDKESELEIFLPNGTYIQIMDCKAGGQYTATPKDSYFMLRKVYYPSGKIWTKGWAYIDFFAKGVWYEFDEGGNLAFKYDCDAPFTYTFEDVLKFCQRNNIKVEKGYVPPGSGWTTTIKREADEDRCVWEIEYLKRFDLLETIYLDGKTGKVIRRESVKCGLE